MTTLRECADTAAAALVEMLRNAKGAVDATAVAEIIEQVLNQATSETEEGAERRIVDLQASMQERLTAARCLAGGDLQLQGKRRFRADLRQR